MGTHIKNKKIIIRYTSLKDLLLIILTYQLKGVWSLLISLHIINYISI